jgi:hypothetical protein
LSVAVAIGGVWDRFGSGLGLWAVRSVFEVSDLKSVR